MHRKEQERFTIKVPRSWEEDIKEGGILPLYGELPILKGWQIDLRCVRRGWVRLYLCSGEMDMGGWEEEKWVLSFRVRDINSRTWKVIKFNDVRVMVQLVWNT